jgi:hypothetical protein
LVGNGNSTLRVVLRRNTRTMATSYRRCWNSMNISSADSRHTV